MSKKDINVLLIGTGGTGSWISDKLFRILYNHSKKEQININCILIEADVVEPKNLIRQAFLPFEVGLNKAYALAKRSGDRFSNFENFKISIIDKYILDDPERTVDLDKFVDFNIAENFAGKDKVLICINCIDNTASRKNIHLMISRLPSSHLYYILDAGNEDVYGQVTMTTNDVNYPNNKTFWQLHPEKILLNDGIKTEASCAEHNEVAVQEDREQTISANIFAAEITLEYIFNILNNIPVYNETGFIIDKKSFVNYRYL